VNAGRIRVASATDGLYVRNAGIPAYGTTSIFDLVDGDRSHGKDERGDQRRGVSHLRGLLLRAGEDAVGQRRSV